MSKTKPIPQAEVEWTELVADVKAVKQRLKLLDTCLLCGSDLQHGHKNRRVEFIVSDYIRSSRVEKICPACELFAAQRGGFERGVRTELRIGSEQ